MWNHANKSMEGSKLSDSLFLQWDRAENPCRSSGPQYAGNLNMNWSWHICSGNLTHTHGNVWKGRLKNAWGGVRSVKEEADGYCSTTEAFFLDILDISFGELCKPTSAERRHYICLRKLNQRRCFLCCQWTQFLQFRPLTSKIELKTRQKVELRWGWKCLVGPVGLALSALPSTCVGGVPPRNPHTTISLQSTLRYNRIKQKYKHERRTRWWGEMHCAKENVVFSAPLDFKSSFGLVKNTKCGNFFHRAI